MKLTTSALALNTVLTSVMRHTPETDRFLAAVAQELNLKGDQSELMVIDVLSKLVRQIKLEIEEIPIDKDDKDRAIRFINRFSGLENFSQIGLSVRNSRSNFLKADYLVDLVSLHSLMAPHVERIATNSSFREMSAKFRTLNSELLDEDIPDDVKRAISTRISQIATILENLSVFGPSILRSELKGLLGEMFLEEKKKSRKFFSKIAVAAMASYTAVGAYNVVGQQILTAEETTVGLIDFGKKLFPREGE